MKELETLKLFRGATSVIELDFTGFNFESNSYCQLTIKKKYNEDIIFQHDFNKSIKYYVTFKDEFTVSLDDDKYKYDIMYMLNDERYPQCSISNIIIDEVVNNYVGDYDENAVQVTEVLAEGVEITQSIKVTTSNVIIVSSNLQERTVTPTKEEQVILAEDGFDGMSKVVVEAIPSEYVIPTLQDKTIEVKPLENKNITADVGFNGLGVVNVIGTIDTETKEVTPTKEIQTITRSDDKYIESVTVNAIPDNYIEPSGEMEIIENGSYDVTDKASVKVETSGGGGGPQPYLVEFRNIGEKITDTYTIPVSNFSYGGTNPIKILVFAFVRSDYTLSDNLTLLYESDYVTDSTGMNQKLLCLEMTRSKDGTISTVTSGRVHAVGAIIEYGGTPILNYEKKGLAVELRNPIKTTNDVNITVFTTVHNSILWSGTFNKNSTSSDRLFCMLSVFENDQMLNINTLADEQPYILWNFTIPFKND